jgi:multidrug resistance efflux pump
MSERMIPLKIADMAVAACNEEIAKLQAENARLKAEVDRLTSDLQMEKENEDRLVRLHQDARNEVERLTKAGNAMEMTLQADFNGCPYEPMIVREAMLKWRLAKSQP